MDVMERIGKCGFVPVVVLNKAEDAVPVARALYRGGIDVMEITFRTDAAAEAIRLVSAECPEMLVGAGTVLTEDQCRRAIGNGARFIVSPGTSDRLLDICEEAGVPALPGAVTATEITRLLERGIGIVKFFPASLMGGLKMMKALTGPFTGLKFIPTGGIGIGDVKEYAAAPFIHAIGGSWVCKGDLIASGDFEKITSLSREVREAIDEVRG